MPVPSWRATGTAAVGTGTVAPPMPTGYQAGDLLICVVETENQTGTSGLTPTTTTGTWAAVDVHRGAGTGGAAGATGVQVFWKIAVASEGTTTVPDSGVYTQARIFAYQNANGATPISGTPVGGTEATSDTSGSATGITVAAAGMRVIVVASNAADTNTGQYTNIANSSLGGFTNRGGNQTQTQNGGGFTLCDGTANSTTVSATTWTQGTASYKAFLTFALANSAATYTGDVTRDLTWAVTAAGAWSGGTGASVALGWAVTAAGAVTRSGAVSAGLGFAASVAGDLGGGVMAFSAHQDDDISFMSPDLLHDIQAGKPATQVIITSGASNVTDMAAREAGARAAWASMAGVADSWTTADAGIAGHPAPRFTLDAAPRLSIICLRITQGTTGSGVLQDLRAGDRATVNTTDGSSTYTAGQLRTALAGLMAAFTPSVVRTHDYAGNYGDGDHSDHHSTAYFAAEALAVWQAASGAVVEARAYEGYGITALGSNVAGADLTAKTNAVNAYETASGHISDPSASYLPRQYLTSHLHYPLVAPYLAQQAWARQAGPGDLVVTLPAESADGACLVVVGRCAATGAGAAVLPTAITDSGGNTWTVPAAVGTSPPAEELADHSAAWVAWCNDAGPASTVTVTIPATASLAEVVVCEWPGMVATGGAVVDNSAAGQITGPAVSVPAGGAVVGLAYPAALTAHLGNQPGPWAAGPSGAPPVAGVLPLGGVDGLANSVSDAVNWAAWQAVAGGGSLAWDWGAAGASVQAVAVLAPAGGASLALGFAVDAAGEVVPAGGAVAVALGFAVTCAGTVPGAALLRSNTCEGSPGAQLTTSNSGGPNQFDRVDYPTYLTFDATHVHRGSTALRHQYPNGTTTGPCMTWSGLTVADKLFVRFYVFQPANPSTTSRLVTITTSPTGTSGPNLFVQTNGTIQIRSNGGTVLATTPALPLNTLVRLEIDLTGMTAGSANCNWAVRGYSGANVDGATPDSGWDLHSTTPVSVISTTLPSAVRFGNVGTGSFSPEYNVWYDDLAVDTTAQPGPAGAGGNTWSGDASVPLGFAATATGQVAGGGGATVPLTWAAAPAAQVTHPGDASVPATWAVTAAGQGTHPAAASVGLGFAVTAEGSVGTAPKTGDVSVPVAWAVTAAGAATHPGGAARDLTWAVTAAGVVTRPGDVTLALGWAVTAAGAIGGACQVPLSFAVTCGGQVTHPAGAGVALGWAVTADGSIGAAPKTGQADVPVAFGVTCAGVVTRPGDVSVGLGWAAAATGQGTHPGGATVGLGWAAAPGAAVTHPAGVAPVALSFTVAATGAVGAVSAVPLSVAVTATGLVTRTGQATVGLGWAASAGGRTTAQAQAAVGLGFAAAPGAALALAGQAAVGLGWAASAGGISGSSLALLAGVWAGAPHGRWSVEAPHGSYAAGRAHGRWGAGAPHA